jgi:hypothetical protein
MSTMDLTRRNERGIYPACLRHDGSQRSPKALIGDPRGERGAVSDQ